MLPSLQRNEIGTSKKPVSQLNTQPMVSPVNASRQPSRNAAHHSGPGRLATPYPVKDFHLLSFASLSWCSPPVARPYPNRPGANYGGKTLGSGRQSGFRVRRAHSRSQAPVSVFRTFESGIGTDAPLPDDRLQLITSILGSLTKTSRSNERRYRGSSPRAWMPVERRPGRIPRQTVAQNCSS